MPRALISRAVLTDLREHFVDKHVLSTIHDSFRDQGIKHRPGEAPSVSGERRQLVEEYYTGLDLTDASDVQRLLHIIEREIAVHQPDGDSLPESPIGRVIIGLEQEGYRIEGYRIFAASKTPPSLAARTPRGNQLAVRHG